MGEVSDFSIFLSAVIDEKSFDRISGYIDGAKEELQKIFTEMNLPKFSAQTIFGAMATFGAMTIFGGVTVFGEKT